MFLSFVSGLSTFKLIHPERQSTQAVHTDSLDAVVASWQGEEMCLSILVGRHIRFHEQLHPGWKVWVDDDDLALRWTVPGRTIQWSLEFSDKVTLEDFARVIARYTNRVNKDLDEGRLFIGEDNGLWQEARDLCSSLDGQPWEHVDENDWRPGDSFTPKFIPGDDILVLHHMQKQWPTQDFAMIYLKNTSFTCIQNNIVAEVDVGNPAIPIEDPPPDLRSLTVNVNHAIRQWRDLANRRNPTEASEAVQTIHAIFGTCFAFFFAYVVIIEGSIQGGVDRIGESLGRIEDILYLFVRRLYITLR
ncbi:hypothetical protein BJ138DRAFT_1226722 [Hygrophoropsis aurantiaca]|uniref:Uncharacterized protein n=1 Tax=Hygrophoropsis aurantiaca TaxID=72124 RepID=A0ACB7ZY71_9AGAM|nr:hypothetical protein BJ138DRAFT_1226722 [Hygrophoropsis aurantiaca]